MIVARARPDMVRVALWEVVPVGAVSGTKLGDDRAAPADVALQSGVLWWVAVGQAGADHGHSPPPESRAPVWAAVSIPAGQTGDDRVAAAPKFFGERGGRGPGRRRRRASNR